jgi:hypothetical protein
MDVREIAQKSKAAIESRGWSKSDLEEPDGKMCIWGAVNYVLTGNTITLNSGEWENFAKKFCSTAERLRPGLRPAWSRPEDSATGLAISINNNSETTWDDMTAILDAIA